MVEESELLEFILEEVEQRLEKVKKELDDILIKTLGQVQTIIVVPSREETRTGMRKKVVRWLDYLKQYHGNTDDYAAEQLGITLHAIRDEWRVVDPSKRRSLPGKENYIRLEVLYNSERKQRGEPEE